MNQKYHCSAIVYQRRSWGLEKVWFILKTLKRTLVLQTTLSCNQIQFQAIIERVLLQGGSKQLSLGTISFAGTWPIFTRTKHKQEILCLYQRGFASVGEQPGAVSLKEVQVWILLPWAPKKTGSMFVSLSYSCFCKHLCGPPLLKSCSTPERLWTNSGYCIQSMWALLCFYMILLQHSNKITLKNEPKRVYFPSMTECWHLDDGNRYVPLCDCTDESFCHEMVIFIYMSSQFSAAKTF